MLKVAALLAMGVAGWALGRRRPAVNLLMIALAVFAAVTAHSGMQAAFVDGRLDLRLGDPRTGTFEGVIVLIAAGEAVGLWVPFLLVPWARFSARVWLAVYSLAAATIAAVYFYFPFDLVILNDALIAKDGPPYLLAWLACLPIGGVGYLLGWMKSMNEAAETEVDPYSGSS